MIFKKLQILFALVTVIIVSLLFLLIITWHKSTQPEEGMMYCGVIDSELPEDHKVAINHPGRKFFERNCFVCHSINDVVIGPALKGIYNRRDSVWIAKAILNFDGLLSENDTTAVALYRKFNQTVHPSYEQINPSDFQLLMEYLKAESMN